MLLFLLYPRFDFEAGEQRNINYSRFEGETNMICLTKLNGVEFVLNCDHIESIQESPDTTIALTNGKLYIVKETMSEIVEKTVAYRRRIYSYKTDGGDING